jgi:hypothetical protein
MNKQLAGSHRAGIAGSRESVCGANEVLHGIEPISIVDFKRASGSGSRLRILSDADPVDALGRSMNPNSNFQTQHGYSGKNPALPVFSKPVVP